MGLACFYFVDKLLFSYFASYVPKISPLVDINLNQLPVGPH